MTELIHRRSFTLRLSALALAFISACSSAQPSEPGNDVPDDSPLYAMTVFVPTADGDSVSYLLTAPSLEADVEIDYRDGIEGTMADVAGLELHPGAWTADSTPTVDSWGLRGDLLELQQTMSFANLGLEYVDLWSGAFVSPELGVVGDRAAGELVRWNPTTMEIEGTLPLDLPGSTDEGYAWFQVTKVRPDGSIIASWQHETYENPDAVTYWFGLLTFNEDATEIVGRAEWEPVDNRSLSLAHGGMTSDGTLYTIPSQACESQDDDSRSCGPVLVSRVLPESTEYDPEWQADLSALTGLDPEWEGSGSRFHVMDDRIVFTMRRSTETGSETKWFIADDALGEAREIDGGDFVGSGDELLIPVDGRLFVPDWSGQGDADALGTTPFYEVTGDGLVPAFTLTGGGIVNSIVRVR